MEEKKKDLPKLIIRELVESSEVRVNRLLNLFLQLQPQEVNELFQGIKILSDSSLTAQCTYYIVLFKDNASIRKLINSSTISPELIEYMILTLYAWALQEDQNEYQIISDLLAFFDQKTYMHLLLDSELISRDKQLIYYIVPKLNRPNLEVYFNTQEDINQFLKSFISLPNDFRKGILAESSDFHGYISMIITSSGSALSIENETLEYSHEERHRIQNLVSEITAHYDMEKERSLPLDKRDKTRLARIVRLINDSSSTDTLNILKKDGVIIDSEEESLIHEILYNPLFKGLYKKYCESTFSNTDSSTKV